MKIPALTEIWKFFRKELDHKTALEEAVKFYRYHHDRGWMMGKYPMKSWRGAAATWRGRIGKVARNISEPRPVQPVKIIKTETDATAYRVEENNKIYEFDDNHPPPDGPHKLAWFNWRCGLTRPLATLQK